jgi:alpha-1,3-mannosyltransferase
MGRLKPYVRVRDAMRLKVLQVARQFYPSVAGVERFTQDLCHHLLERGISSDVLTLNRCFYLPGTLPAQDTVDGIRVIRIPYWGRQRIFFAPGVLSFVSSYDVLHIHNVDFFADFLTLTRPYHHKPIVVSTHGGFFHTKQLALVKKLYFHTVTHLLLGSADQVIADSAHDLRLFSSITNNVIHIENGVDFNRFADVRKQVETGLLVYVGRLVSNKRIDHLIRALPYVRQEMPQARLVIVGCDYEGIQGELQALAAAEGVEEATLFAGQLADNELLDYLSRAHLFVSASEYEGFGISTVEAMSAATVSIVNDIPPFQNLIKDGITGFLTDFSDPKGAADVIISAGQMEVGSLQEMGNRAREMAGNYAWENVVDQYIEVYDKVLR